MTRLGKVSLGLLALFLAMGMFVACSSTEESSDSGSSCAERCASQEPANKDECIIACEADL